MTFRKPANLLVLAAILLAAFAYAKRVAAPPSAPSEALGPALSQEREPAPSAPEPEPEKPPEDPPVESGFGFPISRAFERVTKKPFALKVTKADSPVQPERFSGYHVGVDFEAFEDEQGIEVEVLAICDGPLLAKRRATGYGGVAVQRCSLEGAPVTVVYGHLDLASVTAEVGGEIVRGSRLGVLGEAGPETDGERKHLHLGVREGGAIDIRGYVQRPSEIEGWIDAREHLPVIP